MLQSLSIKNLALIKNESIEFNNGLNIILGETGAGKSLVFEALFFVLGFKTDKSLIRNGEESMKVDVLFSNISQSIKNELANLDIEASDELLISRTITIDGRNSIRINGNIATITTLKSISKNMVDTLIQHESMQLLKSKNHLQMLDSYIGTDSIRLKQELSEMLDKTISIDKQIASLGGNDEERQRKKEILEYQINEIEKANLKPGEDNEINERLSILDSAEKIKETLAYVLSLLLKEDKNAISKLQDSIRALNNFTNLDSINVLFERLNNTKYELQDIAEELQDIFESSTFDEIEYEKLDSRKDLIKVLKKKYGNTIENVLDFYNKAKKQLDDILNSDYLISKLLKEKQKLEDKVLAISKQLSSLRKENAKEIKSRIICELAELGMKGTLFEIQFTEKEKPNQEGIDNVEFAFSANVGQETKKLSKTASGGEMSRIMLAIKNIFASSDRNKTLLFDEVDSGISGETGNMVALKLRNISKNEQIICITHLPQVACAGNHYIKVVKSILDGQTYSNSSIIEGDDIPIEIAKIISGKNITETSINNAKELLSKFNL